MSQASARYFRLPRWTRQLFPGLYGLVIYASIRLVNDIISGVRFWQRSWELNMIEIVISIVVSYLFAWVCRLFIRRLDRYDPEHIYGRPLLREFGLFLLAMEALVVVLLFPIAMFLDDGMQWYDAVNLSLIPVLYWSLFFALSAGNLFMQKSFRQRLQIEKIAQDQLQTELQYLKAQFHPHFLFNALNTVYFQIDEGNVTAKHTVEKLSELLRYQLYDQDNKVQLTDELRFIQAYIDLQSQRMEDHLVLEVNLERNCAGVAIYPLLILPLVENAFKYTGGEYRISVAVKLDQHTLSVNVVNTMPSVMPDRKGAGGIGLGNLRKRLELLYPARHQLFAYPEGSLFFAKLNIEL